MNLKAKITLISFFIFCKANAQVKTVQKKSQFGFYFGLDYNIFNLESEGDSESLKDREAGYSVGIIGQHQFFKQFYISPKMEISFNQNRFDIDVDGKNVQYNVSPVYTTIKSDFVYQLKGEFSKPYFLFGPSYSFAINKDVQSDEFPTGNTFSLSVGIGVDKKMKYFNLAPELRYAYGLSNMRSNPINNGDVYWNRVSLVLYFKG